jgi:hypothetical protein
MGSAARNAGHRADDLARITPELVLVDPELSRRVRHRVPLLFLRRTPPLPALHRAWEPSRPVPDAAHSPVG